MTASIDVLASASLATHTADLVIGVRNFFFFNSKQLGKVLFTKKQIHYTFFSYSN